MLHKFSYHLVSPGTKILILGTFHPDIDNGVDFFYGRPRNYLWRILPACFNYQDLKNQPIEQKQVFMSLYKIDFADIIHSLQNVPVGHEANYDDEFIDGLVHQWKGITQLIDNLKNLEGVYFTRKTFANIPNIELKISEIRNHCVLKCIRFCLLETPSRYSNQRKIDSWTATIINMTTCL